MVLLSALGRRRWLRFTRPAAAMWRSTIALAESSMLHTSAACSAAVRRLIAFEIERARGHYRAALAGLTVLPLSEFGTSHTALVRWAPETYFSPHRHWGGEEIFVVEGVFSDEHGDYPAGSWLRSPHMSQHQPFSREGCLILVKTGHLQQA